MRSRCCLCLCVCVTVYPFIVARQRTDKNPHIVARQRLSRNFTVVTNTHATIENMLDGSFSMWPKFIRNFQIHPVQIETEREIE
jgi:hypothetical protein